MKRIFKILLVVVLLVGLAVGLTWMIRIYRGLSEDEPPPWRYRAR